ncbi:prepilin peptidase [Marimonas arenosa]|uniref:Prepilin peptidase n=1 Tax=Marimonas arenosa TaxID=1795305 RepID=A0AAE3WBZ5_9RHOB|nr:prepilin peptidase [Marimonas arenosa]
MPLLFTAPLLVVMAASDVRHMRIPNWLVLAMIVVFAAVAPFYLSGEEIVMRVAVAGGVLLVGIVAFTFRIVAGGDVKALAALMLFVPAGATSIAYFGFTFSAAMVLGMIFMLTLRRAFSSPESSFLSLSIDAGYPMGLSIALAGLAFPAVHILIG